MATAKSLATAFSVVSLTTALFSCAAACPLGDCDGSAHHEAPAVTFDPDGPAIYAGVTGTYAPDVNYSGTVVQPGEAFVFVEHRFGTYPRIYNGRVYNGGIPQNVNIAAHLNRLRRDIDRDLPRDFDGYAVIDYESWKPLWSSPSIRDEYREASRQKVRQRFPGLSAAQVEARAGQEWEAASREFLLATLAEAKRLRPNAKWGFYSYLGDIREEQDFEPQMDWLWSEVDALYPSIYMRMVSEENWTRQRGTISIAEGRRRTEEIMTVANDNAHGRPIVPLVWRLYKPANPLMGGQPINEHDFARSFEYPLELGADALILWDRVNTRAQQREFEEALRGPFGLQLQRVFGEAGEVYVPPEHRRVTADD